MDKPLLGMPDAPKSAPAEPDDLADAMSDLGEALADKDWAAAAVAFRTACTLCEGGEDDTAKE